MVQEIHEVGPCVVVYFWVEVLAVLGTLCHSLPHNLGFFRLVLHNPPCHFLCNFSDVVVMVSGGTDVVDV